MIIVTGGAGFIGANLVKALNDRGVEDILVVDNLTNPEKINTLADCRFYDYMDKAEFRRYLESDTDLGPVQAVFHEGACSNTMASDGRYVMDNNYTYSKILLQYCQKRQAPFIYASSASVYGSGPVFKEELDYERPLNVYAFSKLAFDNHVRANQAKLVSQVVGLRYFNVYGPREGHKGRMASVAMHFFHQYQEQHAVRLFEGSDGYANGEQRRDFVSVEDVARVNLYFLEHPQISGIYNVGTGKSRSFNAMACAVVNAMRAQNDEAQMTKEAMQAEQLIAYIPMPEVLKGKYQSYTEADMGCLRAAGYTENFLDIEAGAANYIDWLRTEYA